MGGGYFYRTLNKDVKEINKVFLSLFSMGIILIAIFVGINMTENSYALFSDTIVGEKTIEVEVENNIPNPPVLDSSMVPVYYDEENKTWNKADESNKSLEYKWYDYNEKMWANSVTVSSTNRTTYQNAEPGTEIKTEDILTMQVWVPRYKYKVWNYNSDGTKTSDPQEIDIIFERGTKSTGEITCTDNIQGEGGDGTSEICKINGNVCTDSLCNNEYYTHPAFTFGFEELEGFWIGKFELTGTIDNITTKPDLSSIRRQRVGDFATNIMAMNDSNNQYGLSTTTDAHMIKNMEWGAVAYLSHSKYGTCYNGNCHEIGINNNSNYITGCGTEAGSSESTTCNSYNTEEGMLASITGNIYGIYDMNGGSNEYVFGNIVSNDGEQMMSGNTTFYNSGYTGIVYDEGNYTSYTGTYSYPDDKYYDKYSFGTDINQINRSKLGDAAKEVYNKDLYSWYNNHLKFFYNGKSWMLRSGLYYSKSSGGIFYSYSSVGYSHVDSSTRLIIIT